MILPIGQFQLQWPLGWIWLSKAPGEGVVCLFTKQKTTQIVGGWTDSLTDSTSIPDLRQCRFVQDLTAFLFTQPNLRHMALRSHTQGVMSWNMTELFPHQVSGPESRCSICQTECQDPDLTLFCSVCVVRKRKRRKSAVPVIWELTFRVWQLPSIICRCLCRSKKVK